MVHSDLIDFNRLNHNQMHLVVSAVDIETGEVMYFDNQSEVPLSVEHVVASDGLAPGLPMTKAAIERRIASGYQDALAQLEEFSSKSK